MFVQVYFFCFHLLPLLNVIIYIYTHSFLKVGVWSISREVFLKHLQVVVMCYLLLILFYIKFLLYISVGSSWGSYPHTPNWGAWWANLRSNQCKHKDLCENRKGKNHGGRGFHYNSEKITMVIALSHALRFLGLINPPLLLEVIYYLYKWVFLDKIESCCIWITAPI